MADSLQWLSQSDYSNCFSTDILVEFYLDVVIFVPFRIFLPCLSNQPVYAVVQTSPISMRQIL